MPSLRGGTGEQQGYAPVWFMRGLRNHAFVHARDDYYRTHTHQGLATKHEQGSEPEGAMGAWETLGVKPEPKPIKGKATKG